jgi:hypothetical protein
MDEKDAEIEALRRAVANNLAYFQNMIVENTFAVQKDFQRQIDTLQKDKAELRLALENANKEIVRLAALCPKSRDTEMMCVRPYWKPRSVEPNRTLCFLLMPFREPWSNRVWHGLVQSARNSGFDCVRADQRRGRLINEDIWKDLCSAGAVIADLTGSNPNVTYEVGMADVLGKDLILISQTLDRDKIPFDFLGMRLLKYEFSDSGIAKLTDEVGTLLRGLPRNAA